MKSGDPPTETDQATWKKRTSIETAAAQQPKDQDLHRSRHFFDHDYTEASMGLLPTRSKRQRKQAGGSRTLRFALIKQDKFSIPAQERKPRQMKFYLTSQEQHIHYHIQYTQSSVLRNTETASTHQSVSYLDAFPRCDPSMPWRPCCRFQGESPEIIAFPGSEPF
jgi:hypothetical protein